MLIIRYIKKLGEKLAACVTWTRIPYVIHFATTDKKRFLPKTLLAILFLFLLQTHFAHAQGFSLFSISGIVYWVLAKIAFFISWLVASIGGIFIMLEAWIIGFLLDLSTHVTKSLVVKVGFPITLAIANLIFVLGIIVIAIATIIRYEPYGMKQLLWRLVVAALLVNFSLVIVNIPLAISDNLSNYFLQGFTPAPNGSITDSLYVGFGASLAGAFEPQRLMVFNTKNPDPTGSSSATAGSVLGSFLQLISGFAFTCAMIFGVLLTLGALVAMLVVRYVILCILIILMPFAWALWIFPLFRNHWSKWWSQFVRWTFFTPLVIFFLWLAIDVSATINNTSGAAASPSAASMNALGIDMTQYTNPAPTGPAIYASLNSFFGTFFATTVGNLLMETVIIALMMGGLYAANSISIMFADTAWRGMKAGQKGIGKWAGRTAVKASGRFVGGVAGGVAGAVGGGWRGLKGIKNRFAPPTGGGTAGAKATVPLGGSPTSPTGGTPSPTPSPSGTGAPLPGGGPAGAKATVPLGGSPTSPSGGTPSPGFLRSTWEGTKAGTRIGSEPIKYIKEMGESEFFKHGFGKVLKNGFTDKKGVFQSSFGEAYKAMFKSQKMGREDLNKTSAETLRALIEDGRKFSDEEINGLAKFRRDIMKEYDHLKDQVKRVEGGMSAPTPAPAPAATPAPTTATPTTP